MYVVAKAPAALAVVGMSKTIVSAPTLASVTAVEVADVAKVTEPVALILPSRNELIALANNLLCSTSSAQVTGTGRKPWLI